jgi:DNA-binding response OmpR family regulator
MVRILVVDDDPSTRAAIAVALARPHRSIATAADGEDALGLAETFVPHLVITDIEMPRMTGWELVEELRARPAALPAAVIFVTAHKRLPDRLRALRLGATDFLAKPFSLEELELRVENALHAASVARRMSCIPEGFYGHLATFPLAALLSTLAAGRKSGELRVAFAGEGASLLLRDGAVVQASSSGRGSVRGVECVLRVLRWDEGRFGFLEREVTETDEVHASVMALLLENARLEDEAARRRPRRDVGSTPLDPDQTLPLPHAHPA